VAKIKEQKEKEMGANNLPSSEVFSAVLRSWRISVSSFVFRSAQRINWNVPLRRVRNNEDRVNMLNEGKAWLSVITRMD
jgi:hypothetical protein